MPLVHAPVRATATARTALAIALLGASTTRGSAHPVPIAQTPTQPPAVTVSHFAGLRWLVGSWRGRMPDGGSFYEDYAFANDSTMVVRTFADSTFGLATETDSIVLRQGVVSYGPARATRVEAGRVDFARVANPATGFTFIRTEGGGWTAAIRNPSRTVVYVMERASRDRSRRARPTSDRDAVRRAVLDYVEGFYEGDTAKLARSVWPEVRKYGYARSAAGTYRGMAMSFPAGFMDYATGVRAGRHKTPANARKDIAIFDVQDQTASAKLTAWWGTDYLLLAREGDRWMITHVLWQSPPVAAR
jgi:hypothetical protein